ncbi:uncharacterized protein MYCFIDRAFT_75704 [Pseudocercospora fijiensis CIRAD86]|uniref:Uncharacterized protein n=1 Tax=Pseudocercospora fijiensis (strain CIRAD86) TaxID=383855 RepID=N1Q6E0_PSEFD|nr:uncharacterized protein MYCFIDRAFT_75704 [Pseudocercospora fijiensis CIRAD86]EME87874.1 hypothetical protein MYCFIDRAFT_75704 [Pseudocercospora fijiensis CIRAD86]
MPPLDAFNRRFDNLMRNRTEFFIDHFLERYFLAISLPQMSANEPTHYELAERCARIRTEINACEKQRLSAQQGELSIRADASAVIKMVEKIRTREPWSYQNLVFFRQLYEDFHDRVYQPFLQTHRAPWGEVDRLWQVQDCLADVETALMSIRIPQRRRRLRPPRALAAKQKK